LPYATCFSIAASFIGLPDELKYSFGKWNPMTHGNITFVIFLLSVRYVKRPRMHSQAVLTNNFARLAWFAGVGRTAYYYGKRVKVD
jgi:hypothetical protein